MSKPEFCGKCPHKSKRDRYEFDPAVVREYWCEHPNLTKPKWIGFIDQKLGFWFCPLGFCPLEGEDQ